MTLIRAVVAAAAACLAASPALCAETAMARYNPHQTSYTGEKLEIPLKLAWSHVANKYDNNPASPVVADGVCFFACGDRVYAVDMQTGEMKWRYPVDTSLGGMVRGAPAVHKGLVYFGAGDGNLYCLSADTGTFQWAYQTRGAIRCPPVVADDVIYVGSDDNSIYAIHAGSGEAAWIRPFTARDDMAVGVAVGSGMVVVACMDGYMYGVLATSGRLRWSPFRLPAAPINTSPIISESVVIMAVGNIMYGLSVRSGQQRWAVTLPSEVAGNPAVDGADIYVPCKDRKIYAYTASGRQVSIKWTEPADLGTSFMSGPIIADDTIYATGSRGVVAAFSTADGSLKWRYTVSPSSVTTPGASFTDASSSPLVADGALLVLTDDGVLHCFRPDAPDNVPPVIMPETPANGRMMSGAPPIKISAVIYDIGSGVDFSTVAMYLDNQPVVHEVDIGKFTVSYTTPTSTPGKPVRPLPDGPHTITVSVKDYAGNLATKEWYFIADSGMPPPRRMTVEERQPGRREREPRGRTTPPTPPAQPPAVPGPAQGTGGPGEMPAYEPPPPPPPMPEPGAPGPPGTSPEPPPLGPEM